MKTRIWTFLGALCLILAGVSVSARADVLTVSPSHAAVLAAAEDGWTRTVLQFDLSGMRAGQGRKVVWAYIEWQVNGAGPEEKEFFAYPVLTPWTEAQAIAPGGSISYGETPVSDWELTTGEQERLGCLVRLQMKPIVADWLSGMSSNYGIVIATRDISGNVLSDQLQNARLVVGYGFYGSN